MTVVVVIGFFAQRRYNCIMNCRRRRLIVASKVDEFTCYCKLKASCDGGRRRRDEEDECNKEDALHISDSLVLASQIRYNKMMMIFILYARGLLPIINLPTIGIVALRCSFERITPSTELTVVNNQSSKGHTSPDAVAFASTMRSPKNLSSIRTRTTQSITIKSLESQQEC